MKVVQIPFVRKTQSRKWTSILVKIKDGTVECDFGGDVESENKPPDLRLVDDGLVYNILYFEDIVEANIWLVNLAKSLKKEGKYNGRHDCY